VREIILVEKTNSINILSSSCTFLERLGYPSSARRRRRFQGCRTSTSHQHGLARKRSFLWLSVQAANTPLVSIGVSTAPDCDARPRVCKRFQRQALSAGAHTTARSLSRLRRDWWFIRPTSLLFLGSHI